MRGIFVRHFGPGRAAALAAVVLCLLLGLIGGCSDDAPPQNGKVVTGKTPVIRPEDAKAQERGSAVLAPDYRRDMVAEVPPAQTVVPGVSPTSSPGTDRLSADKPKAANLAGGAARPVAASSGGAGAVTPGAFPRPGCRQLVVVVTPDWAAAKGVLHRLVRDGADGTWREAGEPVPCALGRKGLGVGRGLSLALAGPAKREGDGRTPAGLFSLPEAFGYAGPEEARKKGVRLPYVAVTDRSACVTDPDSSLFGRIAGPEKRASAKVEHQDRMWRTDRANVWGVVIGHNRIDPTAKAGTCLFVNVRPAGGPPTGGSIGLPEPAVAALAAWLDPAADPLLLVVPAKIYAALRTAWKLP